MKIKDRNKQKNEKKQRRHKRIRAKVFGSAEKPRLCVFKSSKHIYAQIIDDEKSKTLFSASDFEVKKNKAKSKTEDSKERLSRKNAIAFEVGKLIAKKAVEGKIKKIVFDRSGYAYHGNIKSLAEGAREGGLKF
jgi:large subunit ribosomal protein L18